MDRKIALVGIALLVLVSGCTEPLDEEAGIVKASTGEWLETEQGIAKFPEGSAGDPIRIWKEGEVFYWIMPIENSNGLYIGNLVVTNENFTFPKQIQIYKEPRDRILNYTREEAHQQMIMETDYPAYQISKPILITRANEGLFWYSEVRADNELIAELHIETFTLF